MSVHVNDALFRYLTTHGANEEQAFYAATTVDAEALATKADLDVALARLKADLADLKAELFRHTTQVLLTATGIYAGIVGVMLLLLRAIGGGAP